ncbi:sigma-E processing peptidase SpoIIGA [Lentibacillus sediminis]|uniref:sigma-E processing peptidase SpoIIGA n=1 Tax=Lentibacillus sediminis TaxID=1940529 RepID=UPI000C1BE7BE|nr:sigma-E processing peptidase SpoIIGA [Lentibacillus sediminis]
MTIYLDAVWALNFFLDMMLLMLTQALARDGTGRIRIAAGALIASLLVPVTIYFPDSFFSSPLGKFLYSIIIIICAFGYSNLYRMAKLLGLFYFVTFAIGGGLIAVHFLFRNPFGVSADGILTYNSGYGDPISWLFVAACFPAAWYFTKSRMDKHGNEKIRYDQLCPVTIQLNNQGFSTTGYIDSGNQLTDPLTKKPVIICDQPFLSRWFTEEDWKRLQTAHETLRFDQLPEKWEKQIQLVPYQGVQGSSMFLLAIRPEQIIIHYGEENIITNKVLIGIQFADLSKDDSYHCLLHPQIIKSASVYSA